MRLLLLLVFFSSGCVSERFSHSGPVVHQAQRASRAMGSVDDRLRDVQAIARPRLTVDPSEALFGAYHDVVLSQHQSRDQGQRFVLTFTLETGARVSMQYALARGIRLPLEEGIAYRLRLFPAQTPSGQRFLDEAPIVADETRGVFVLHQRRPNEPDLMLGGLDGWSLVVRDRSNKLMAMVFSGRWREFDPNRDASKRRSLGAGIQLAVLDRLAYSEVRITEQQCRATLEHLAVAAVTGGRTLELLPGTSTILQTPQATYRLTLFDAGKPVPGPCVGEGRAHVSFALGLVDLSAVDD